MLNVWLFQAGLCRVMVPCDLWCENWSQKTKSSLSTEGGMHMIL